jgi:hypothetical protein
MEHIYTVPPRGNEDLIARLSAAVTMVDANMLRRVRGNALQRTAVYLETDGGCFENLLQLRGDAPGLIIS